MNKSLFTAYIKSADNAGSFNYMPSAGDQLFYNCNPASLASWLSFNNATFDYNAVQVTSTVYDIPSSVTQLTAPVIPLNPVTFTQQPYTLRNRVSYTQYYDMLQNNSSVVNGETIYTPLYGNYTTGTYYTYDIHGNVDTLLQDYRIGAMANHGYNRFKEIAYNYDLISGKVNEVDYNPGNVDQFYHRYEYDAENRITDVYTSDNKAYVGHKNLEEHEAFYEYYKHGPLARAVVGQQQVQGLDYAYTLQGWLKGVNSTSLQPTNDMGNDGMNGSPNQSVARDAYGFNINYFSGEYTAINPGVLPFPGHSGYMPSADYKPLYNGNISSMAVNIGQLNAPLLYNYQYDQLNRIVSMDAFNGLNQASNNWTALTKISDYQERLTYDANGNVETGLRSGSSSQLALENFQYNYDAVDKNKLLSIQNSVNSQAYNYSYNAIGETTKDDLAGNTLMEWNVYGKLTRVVKTDGTDITFTYDASGNRISKTVSGSNGYTEWYANDASGNIMAVYKNIDGSNILNLAEQDIYGSSRLSVYYRGIDADASLPTGTSASLIGNYIVSYFSRGYKNYYFGNHLGNTMVIISDRKMQHSSNGTTVDYNNADVVSFTDYSPFGSNLIDRSFNSNNILYGFNGKWNDFETGYENYGMRMYSSNERRFKTVDPLTSDYAWYSPYQFAGNSPILAVDIDGMEPDKSGDPNSDKNAYKNKDGTTEVKTLETVVISVRTKSKADHLILNSKDNVWDLYKQSRETREFLTSKKGIQFLVDYEAYSKDVYDDGMRGFKRGKGNATIGYGTKLHDGITTEADLVKYANGVSRPQAFLMMMNELYTKEQAVNTALKVNKIVLTQNQFDAIMIFSYNGGPGIIKNKNSDLTKALQSGNPMGIRNAFNEYNRSGPKGNKTINRGLMIRREHEADIFLNNVYDSRH